MGQKIYESDKFLKTGGTSSQYLMADGTTSTGPTGGVDVGTGTANKVPKFSDSDTITDGIMTDDGTSVLVGGNLAIGTGDNDNLFHIEATDNVYDVSRAMEIDYTKSHTTTGWGASVFGARVNVYADGTGQQADVQGGSFSATHNGSGVSYYLLGSQSNANHLGSGNTGAIWGAYNRGKVTGSGTGTHPFLIGTNQVAELNNTNASVGKMQAIVAYAKTTAGSITTRVVGAEIGLDCNQGAATAVDAAVLHLEADVSNLTVSGNSRTINSVSTLPSVFAGTIEADELIKTGGTSSEFLKADGSVDSNTYLTSGDVDLSVYLPLAGGTLTGDLAIPSTLSHAGDSNTFLQFSDDQLVLKAGGRIIIKMDEGTDPDLVQLGDSTTVTYTEGDFGVGTTSPSKKLHIKSSNSGDGLLIENDTSEAALYIKGVGDTENTYSFVKNSGVDGLILRHNDDNLGFGGNIATFARTGNVGIGTISPGHALDIDSGAANSALRVLSTDRYTGIKFEDDTNNDTLFYDGQTDLMYLPNTSFRAASLIKTGGLSTEFLKADGSVDSSTYITSASLPTDFVSAAGGGTFGGDIIADSFALPGGSSSRFLKADGSTDANTYVTGAGTSGNIAIFDTTNGLIDNSNLSFNFITSKVTMGADLDVTGDIATTNVTADAYHNQQVILTSNFSHTSNAALSYYSMPFGSLGESVTAGEQHFFVSPGSYRLRTIIMRNTSTGATLTSTTNNFRVVKNGTTLWTGASNFFGSGQGAYSANALNDSDATWALGDMIQFQFTTNGDWKDATATMVLELI